MKRLAVRLLLAFTFAVIIGAVTARSKPSASAHDNPGQAAPAAALAPSVAR